MRAIFELDEEMDASDDLQSPSTTALLCKKGEQMYLDRSVEDEQASIITSGSLDPYELDQTRLSGPIRWRYRDVFKRQGDESRVKRVGYLEHLPILGTGEHYNMPSMLC